MCEVDCIFVFVVGDVMDVVDYVSFVSFFGWLVLGLCGK